MLGGKHHKDIMAKASSTSKSVESFPVKTFHHNINYIHYIIMIFILYKLVGAVCP